MIVMIAVSAVAVSAVRTDDASRSSVPASAAAPDPLLGKLVVPEDNLPAFHRRVQTERRDEPWASRSEAALRDRYARLPYLGPQRGTLRVICAGTVCEVAGVWPKKLSKVQDRTLMHAFQGSALKADLRRFGLADVAQGFGDVFVAYWRRTSG